MNTNSWNLQMFVPVLSSVVLGVISSLLAVAFIKILHINRLGRLSKRLTGEWSYFIRDKFSPVGRMYIPDKDHISLTISARSYFSPTILHVERRHKSVPEGVRTWTGEIVLNSESPNQGTLNWQYEFDRVSEPNKAEFGTYSVTFVPPSDIYLTPIGDGTVISGDNNKPINDKDITWLRKTARGTS